MSTLVQILQLMCSKRSPVSHTGKKQIISQPHPSGRLISSTITKVLCCGLQVGALQYTYLPTKCSRTHLVGRNRPGHFVSCQTVDSILTFKLRGTDQGTCGCGILRYLLRLFPLQQVVTSKQLCDLENLVVDCQIGHILTFGVNVLMCIRQTCLEFIFF